MTKKEIILTMLYITTVSILLILMAVVICMGECVKTVL
jgi:hypothetical protein